MYYLTLFLILVAGVVRGGQEANAVSESLRGCLGTYGRPLWKTNNHADVKRLLRELGEIHANTFHWSIHAHANEWQEIKAFLPLAGKKHINVWITVMPPSESPPRLSAFSEPFRLDYERWATEIARLSLVQTNLVAWSIDDFTHNLNRFTPEYVEKMQGAAHAINPKLAFVPCCYFNDITPAFADQYNGVVDGVLFPYRDESGGANLTVADHVESEIASIRKLLGPRVPIVLDVYATAHSRLGASTPQYVEEVIKAGLLNADGVMIYRHQDPKVSPEKYEIIKRLFGSARRDFPKRASR